MSENANGEVTISVTLTRSEWCEVVNAIGIRGNVICREYEESDAKMDPDECTCGAYDGYTEEQLEEYEGDYSTFNCVCFKNWAEQLRSAYRKIAAACDERGVMY